MMRRQVVGRELASPRNPNLVLTRFRRLPEERDRCLRLWDLEDEKEENRETVGKLPKRSFSFSLTQLRRTLSSAKVETFRGGERRGDTGVGGGGWGRKGRLQNMLEVNRKEDESMGWVQGELDQELRMKLTGKDIPQAPSTPGLRGTSSGSHAGWSRWPRPRRRWRRRTL